MAQRLLRDEWELRPRLLTSVGILIWFKDERFKLIFDARSGFIQEVVLLLN